MPSSSTGPSDVDYLRNRVRLYLQVMLTIDIFAYISDYVSPLLIDGLTMPEYPLDAKLIRWGVTLFVVAGWLFTRWARPSRAVTIGLEVGVTICLSLVYVRLADAQAIGANAEFAPLFTMFGMMLLLSVRASLVPSPLVRTALVSAASVMCLFVVANEAVQALDPRVIDGLTFIALAAVLSTTVTSHVIYGLRREVRKAQQLGQYTLEEKLGEGGMGAVYRARHAMLRRQAAIKLIRPELAGKGSEHSQANQRFEREAHATANLKSPHTIQLYDFGVSAEGVFYYVMELLDGIDLETAVARFGPMPADRVVFLLRQVCDSLEEAHADGLVHRDIKPANIFMCRHGLRYDFVKVLDFGLVALAPHFETGDPKLTRDGVVGGTPAYLAPEMAADPETVDSRADMYALGCVAYWLLTGQAPYVRDTPMATILAHVRDVPTPPADLSENEIPASLNALVLDCLAKDPNARPASARDFRHRLDESENATAWNNERAKRWWTAHMPGPTAGLGAVHREAAASIADVSELVNR